MVMLLLLLVSSLADINICTVSSDVPSNQAETGLDGIQYKLFSLENSLAEKNTYALEKDKEILFLEKKIEELKEQNKEKLHQLKSRVDEEETRLEDILQRKTSELDNVRRQIHALEDYQEKQSSEFKELERTLEDQRKTLADIHNVLHVTDASVLELQSHLESKILELKKGSWKEKAHMLRIEWYKRLEIKTEHFFTCIYEVRRTFKDKCELIVALSKHYVDVPLAFSEPYISNFRTHLEPFARKLTQRCDELIKSAIAFHLKLQQNTWIILKSSKYLTPLAACKEIVWLLATSFVVVLLYGAFQLLTFLGGHISST